MPLAALPARRPSSHGSEKKKKILQSVRSFAGSSVTPLPRPFGRLLRVLRPGAWLRAGGRREADGPDPRSTQTAVFRAR